MDQGWQAVSPEAAERPIPNNRRRLPRLSQSLRHTDQGNLMDIQTRYLVSSGLCWLIVVMAAAGYFLTLRRLKQKWAFWLMLIIGWAFLAISNTLSALSIGQGTDFPAAI